MEKLKQFFGKVSDYCKKAVQWFMGLPKKAHIIIAVVLTAILVGTGTGLIVSSLNKTPAEPTVSIIDGYVAINGVKTEHKVENDATITVEDGYLVVNGVKTEHEVKGPEHVHTYDDWTLYDESVSDCEKKLYYRFCPGCSGMEWKKGAHEYESNYSFNASLHWKKCKNCEHTSAEEEHIAGEDNLCTTCGAALGATEGLVYELSDDGTYAMLLAYEGTATRIRIAEEYMGVPVAIIGSNVFENNNNIISVIIPDSVTSIGENSFYYCKNLTSVVIPDSVTSIDRYAFYGCYKLTSVVIPNSVTYIGYGTFGSCDDLASVVIPDSVTYIGDRAFSWCNSALYTEYKYGKYVKSGDNPYAVMIEITNKNFSTYEIHEDTKIIAHGVFSACSRLSSIIIPDSVTSIGVYAFYYCSSLTDVYYTGTEEQWAAITIGSSNYYLTNATIHYNYVPEE